MLPSDIISGLVVISVSSDIMYNRSNESYTQPQKDYSFLRKACGSSGDNVRAQTKRNIAWADRLGSQLAKADHTRIVVLPPATGKLE